MSQTIFTPGLSAVFTPTSDIMRGGQDSTSVQQDLDDLVVVGVSGEDQGGDVRGEGGRVCR